MSDLGNIWEGTENQEVSGFQPGKIYDNVVIDNVSYFAGQSKSGNNYEAIRITYKREVGSTVNIITDQILPFSSDGMKSWSHEVSFEETVKKQKIKYYGKFKHIASKLGVTDEVLMSRISNVSSFADFAYKFKSLIDEYNKNQKMYLKLGINKSGYAEVQSYAGFLQPMEDGECLLKFTETERKNIKKYQDSRPADDEIEEIEDYDLQSNPFITLSSRRGFFYFKNNTMSEYLLYPNNCDELSEFVSEEEIYFNFFGPFENNVWYNSPFRDESNPSFKITYYKGKWVWRDFGIDPRPNDAIGFVMQKFNISYQDAINLVYEVIVLKKECKKPLYKKLPKSVEVRKPSCRVWKIPDKQLTYWLQRGISLEACEYYNIKYGEVWYYDRIVLRGFVYLFDKINKIWKGYNPFGKKSQFFGNNVLSHIQNYDEIEKTHNFWGKEYCKKIVFITKSYKDCIIINNLGYHAIAPHTESLFIDPWDLDYLKQKFKYVYVFYDNDKTGVEKCIKFTEQYDLFYINIPTHYNLKDPDDIVFHHSYAELKKIIDDRFKRDRIQLY